MLEKTLERTKPLKENRTWISSEPSGQSLSLHLFYPSLYYTIMLLISFILLFNTIDKYMALIYCSFIFLFIFISVSFLLVLFRPGNLILVLGVMPRTMTMTNTSTIKTLLIWNIINYYYYYSLVVDTLGIFFNSKPFLWDDIYRKFYTL